MNNFKDKIQPDDRIIMAKKDILPLKFPVVQSEMTRYNPFQKPRGLWYGIGTSWIDWVESEMPEWEGKFIYKLEINEPFILMLKNEEELNNFTVRFGRYPEKDEAYHQYVKRAYASEQLSIEQIGPAISIDWLEVSLLYAGIEISPYQWDSRSNLHWYYPWDVASGCLWNKKAIKQIKRCGDVNSK